MEEPDFWDNPEKSNGYMKELKGLKADIEDFKKLEKDKTDAEEFIEMAYEENDESLIPEIGQLVDNFEALFEKLQMETLLSGEYDKCNAILTLHAERARQMPVIREKQQPQPVEPLQVDDLQFRGVEPVVADDAALFVEQVGEDHLRREVGIDDPFAGHKLVPQVKQIRRRHPEPRQRLPEPVQSPALCLLFHSVSPDSGF